MVPLRRHFPRWKGLSRHTLRRKIRLLRSQNEIHLGSRFRLRRHSLRRHRRQRPDFRSLSRTVKASSSTPATKPTSACWPSTQRQSHRRHRTERPRLARHQKIRTPTRAKIKTKNPPPEGFVLYETSKREVTALAVAPDGNIYAAAIGERQHANTGSTAIISTSGGTTTIICGGAISGAPRKRSRRSFPFPPLLSGSIYKITPDGAPEELWTSREDVVYSLALNSEGRLLAGTGNNGALLAIDGRGVFAQLAKAGSAQITGITRGSNGKIFLCTANPGKVFSVGPEYQPEGTYESRSFDAGLFSKWGRIEWWSPPPATPNTKRFESEFERAATRILRPLRQHRRSRQRVVALVRPLHKTVRSRSSSRAFRAMESRHPRRPIWRRHRVGHASPISRATSLQSSTESLCRIPTCASRAPSSCSPASNLAVTLKNPPAPNTTGVYHRVFGLRQNSNSLRKASNKKVPSPCSGPPTTKTKTICASPSFIAAKMKKSGKF